MSQRALGGSSWTDDWALTSWWNRLRRARRRQARKPPEAGARRARLYGASSAAENRNRDNAVEPVRCRRAKGRRADPVSADFEHMTDLPLAAWCLPTALLWGQALLLADQDKSGA